MPEPKAQTESEPDAELTEFAELQAEEAKRAAQVEVDFAQARAQMDATCESMGQQIAMFLGKAIPLALDWASIPKAVEAAGDLLNHGLSPVLGGLAVLSQSPPDRAAAVEKVGAIVLRAAEKPAAQGFSMEDATLVFSTCLGARTPVMDPQTAAGLLTKTLASKVTGTKSNAPKKPPAKPTPAKTAAKRASSAAARPKAPKPAAKTKPAAKEKPAPKKKKK